MIYELSAFSFLFMAMESFSGAASVFQVSFHHNVTAVTILWYFGGAFPAVISLNDLLRWW